MDEVVSWLLGYVCVPFFFSWMMQAYMYLCLNVYMHIMYVLWTCICPSMSVHIHAPAMYTTSSTIPRQIDIDGHLTLWSPIYSGFCCPTNLCPLKSCWGPWSKLFMVIVLAKYPNPEVVLPATSLSVCPWYSSGYSKTSQSHIVLRETLEIPKDVITDCSSQPFPLPMSVWNGVSHVQESTKGKKNH